MDRSDAIRLLASRAAEIRRRGIRSLSLFGSMVRGEARPDGDINLLVEVDWQSAPGFSLIELSDLQIYLSGLLSRPAQVVLRTDLHPMMKDRILAEEVRTF